MSRILWIIKQLLPLTYRGLYEDEQGVEHFSVWRMWFGRVFAHDDVIMARSND